MVYAIVLAGGTGSRMKSDLPKQFLILNGKQIILHKINKLLSNKNDDKIVVACKQEYIDYLEKLLKENNISNVDITVGGSNRLYSVVNGIKHIKNNYGINEEDIFLAHDSVRPFVSNRIIQENIENAKKHKAATTVIDLIETIVETDNENMLYKSYLREVLFSVQSPQTFNIKFFLENYDNVPKELKDTFTDLSEIVFYNKLKVFPVIGERENIKITTPIDLVIAENLMNN